MFNLEKEECCFNTTEQLLYNIWQELKILNGNETEIEKPVEQALEDTTDTEDTKDKQIPCKACGGTHENMGAMLACCRKNKKNK